MRFYPILVSFYLAIWSLCSLAKPLASPWEDVHSKHSWNSVPENWLNLGHPAADTTIDLHIALKAQHENALIDALYEVSNPEHPKYGRHLSKEQVAILVAPPPDVLVLVHAWLGHHGVLPSTISTIHGSSWLILSGVPVSRANDILSASYQLYQHIGTNETVLRTIGYGLPAVLYAHVQTVAPTTHFGLPLMPSQEPLMRRGGEARVPENISAVEQGAASLLSGQYYVAPPLLRWQYQTLGYIPSATRRNVLGVAGFLNQYPNPDDFSLFMNAYRSDSDSAIFTVVNVHGGEYNPNIPGSEASQNVQYAAAMAYPTTIFFYNTGGSKPFRWHDDPFISWFYYVLSRTNVPQTITASYGHRENIVPPDYAIFVCKLIAMLGVRGASVIFSTGNNGVGSGSCLSEDRTGNKYVRFVPSFPSTCPWVTSVGGTVGFNPEVAASFSGGGFSEYFARPSYQDHAVLPFLYNLGSQYHGLYNAGGRGIPDISVQANDFLYVLNKQLLHTGGTSCSAPTAAGIISLLNDYLLSTGRPPLGWLNPWLYSRGFAGLNDIMFGSNPGCKTIGFPATPGWDPVTGLGSLDFKLLMKVLDSR